MQNSLRSTRSKLEDKFCSQLQDACVVADGFVPEFRFALEKGFIKSYQ